VIHAASLASPLGKSLLVPSRGSSSALFDAPVFLALSPAAQGDREVVQFAEIAEAEFYPLPLGFVQHRVQETMHQWKLKILAALGKRVCHPEQRILVGMLGVAPHLQCKEGSNSVAHSVNVAPFAPNRNQAECRLKHIEPGGGEGHGAESNPFSGPLLLGTDAIWSDAASGAPYYGCRAAGRLTTQTNEKATKHNSSVCG